MSEPHLYCFKQRIFSRHNPNPYYRAPLLAETTALLQKSLQANLELLNRLTLLLKNSSWTVNKIKQYNLYVWRVFKSASIRHDNTMQDKMFNTCSKQLNLPNASGHVSHNHCQSVNITQEEDEPVEKVRVTSCHLELFDSHNIPIISPPILHNISWKWGRVY